MILVLLLMVPMLVLTMPVMLLMMLVILVLLLMVRHLLRVPLVVAEVVPQRPSYLPGAVRHLPQDSQPQGPSLPGAVRHLPQDSQSQGPPHLPGAADHLLLERHNLPGAVRHLLLVQEADSWFDKYGWARLHLMSKKAKAYHQVGR